MIGLLQTFLASMGLYPIEELKLSVGSALPVPILLLGMLVILQGVQFAIGPTFAPIPRRSLVSGVSAIALFLLLLMASLGAWSVLPYTLDAEKLKGIMYILALPVLYASMRKVPPERLFLALLLGCVFAVGVGYWRFFTLQGGIPQEHLLGYWGIRYAPSTRNSDVLYPTIATILASGLLLGNGSRWRKNAARAAFVFGLLAVFLSLSRGAWIAMGCGLLAIHGQQLLKPRRLVRFFAGTFILAAVVGGVFALLPSTNKNEISNLALIAERVASFGGGDASVVSNADRKVILAKTLEGMVSYPLGIGVGNIGWFFDTTTQIGNAENAYVTLGAEGGWLAMGFFTLLIAVLWHAALKAAQPLPDYASRIPLGLITGLATYFLFNYEANSLFVWSTLAVAWAAATPEAPLCFARDKT